MKKFLISSIITLVFLSSGFLLLHYNLIGYGFSFFVFLPLLLGFLLGESTFKSWSLYGLIFSIITFFLLLLIGELEGMVCILMAMPLVLIAVAFGALDKYLYRKYRKKSDQRNNLKFLATPFLLFVITGGIENQLTIDDQNIVSVKSEMILPYSPVQVYDAIKSVDTLDTEKPFLMKLDLPVPHKCILEEEKVGGVRTCYFEGGKIVERITELEKGKVLRMDVIDYQLTGRKWLGFKKAIYNFEELENGYCKITRITTYTSELYPRIYWQPLEKIGIEQEHEYVLRNLEKDLNKTAGNKY